MNGSPPGPSPAGDSLSPEWAARRPHDSPGSSRRRAPRPTRVAENSFPSRPLWRPLIDGNKRLADRRQLCPAIRLTDQIGRHIGATGPSCYHNARNLANITGEITARIPHPAMTDAARSPGIASAREVGPARRRRMAAPARRAELSTRVGIGLAQRGEQVRAGGQGRPARGAAPRPAAPRPRRGPQQPRRRTPQHRAAPPQHRGRRAAPAP